VSPYAPGIACDWPQIAVGFQRLGHEVYYVEEVEPNWCVDSEGRQCPFERSINRELFQATMEWFGLWDRACQIYNRGEATSGLPLRSLAALAKGADLLVNISGHVKTDIILSNVQRRVYVDQDPVYTQLWCAEYGKELNFKAHDVFFTVGLNIGTRCSPIPDCGVQWHPILPPVVPEFWPFRIDPACNRFTTVASWGGFGDVSYRGEWYRSKYEEFERFAGLPGKVNQGLEVALRRYRDDDIRVQRLKDNGWLLFEASQITDLSSYQRYIARSRAEIGIAKNAYVKGHSGWFSDRAAHYLVSGKPVLAQATGFERHLPTGQGLLAFSTMEEAVAGIESINRDYETHCRAARRLAEEYLDSRKILTQMLEIATR